MNPLAEAAGPTARLLIVNNRSSEGEHGLQLVVREALLVAKIVHIAPKRLARGAHLRLQHYSIRPKWHPFLHAMISSTA